MSDPPSTTASVAALCQTTTTIIRYLKHVKDAPTERMQLLVDLAALQTLLHALQARVKDSKTGDEWFTGIQELVVPGGPFDQFALDLQKLELELGTPGEIGTLLTWKFDVSDITSIIPKIDRMKTLLSLALASDNFSLSRAMEEEISRIIKTPERLPPDTARLVLNEQDREYRKIVEWLSPLNFTITQNDIFHTHEEGTGMWLFESQQFKHWVGGMSGTLWCHGMPGTGKTVLTSVVINHLMTSLREENIALLCLFCNYHDRAEQTALSLVASLLKQIVQDSGSISEDVRALYHAHAEKNTRPGIEGYLAVFKTEASNFSRVFIIVDALDECQEDDARPTFLKTLQSLSTFINVLVTSRDVPSNSREFQRITHLKIRAHDEDIRKYLKGRIHRAPRRHMSSLQTTIVDTIVEKSHGVFLLARLHIDSLMGKHNVAAIRVALGKLPKELDESYDEAMNRIQRQTAEDGNLAKDVISWLSHASRSLSVEELQYALAVTSDMNDMDSECLTDEDFLVDVCAGLVVIDEESNKIRLVHHTTCEYFKRRIDDIIPDSQARITKTCLTYLSFDIFGKSYCKENKELDILFKTNPLLEYAALHWGDHARGKSEEQCTDTILYFLQDSPSYPCASQVLLARLQRDLPPSVSPQQFSGMHTCAFFGLQHIATCLLAHGVEADALDSHGRTPLCWAAICGHVELVKLLVARDDVNVNHADKDGWTSLHWAASKGLTQMVDLLVTRNGIEVNQKEKFGRTPLSCATMNGHDEVVTLLTSRGRVDFPTEDV